MGIGTCDELVAPITIGYPISVDMAATLVFGHGAAMPPMPTLLIPARVTSIVVVTVIARL